MIIADAVLETYFDAAEFTAWPIAELPADRLLALSGQMSPAEVGTAMAVVFEYAGVPAQPLTELHSLMDRHLVEAEALLLPGGLRFRDLTARAEIEPGCCCGLENWRDWRDILHGSDEVHLGHDPDTTVQISHGTVRLDQDRHAPSPRYPLSTLEIGLDDLAVLLATVHQRLQGFLDLVGQWAGHVCPKGAGRLVEILDDNLHITGPFLLD